jgi:hypothetical protein
MRCKRAAGVSVPCPLWFSTRSMWAPSSLLRRVVAHRLAPLGRCSAIHCPSENLPISANHFSRLCRRRLVMPSYLSSSCSLEDIWTRDLSRWRLTKHMAMSPVAQQDVLGRRRCCVCWEALPSRRKGHLRDGPLSFTWCNHLLYCCLPEVCLIVPVVLHA